MPGAPRRRYRILNLAGFQSHEGKNSHEIARKRRFIALNDILRSRQNPYSAYARGLDGLSGMYQWLDRAPRGRNETGAWFRRHDEYNKG